MRREFALLVVLLAACGGGGGGPGDDGSGLDRSRQVGSLSEAERRDLCEWGIEVQGGEGTVTDCGDGVTVTVDTVDDCVEGSHGFDACAITVGQLEDCNDAVGEDPCSSFAAPACGPVLDCLFQS